MRRLLVIAPLVVGLGLPLSLFAQRRGGSSHGFSGGSARIGGFSSFRPAPAPVAGRALRPRASGWQPFGSRPFPGGFSGHHHRPRGQSFFIWGSPFGYPYAPYGWFPPDEYPSADYASAQGAAAQPAPEADAALEGQVERLTEEVEALRGQQGPSPAGPVAEVAADEAPASKPVAAVLVYRDGRQREIENYAVLGDTVWVFAGPTTRRIALAELDLKATQRLNDERGVDFIHSPSVNSP